MKYLVLVGALLLPAQAAPANDSGRAIWTIGGTQSCAAWLASVLRDRRPLVDRRLLERAEYAEWVQRQSWRYHDLEGIIGEIRRVCQAEPSLLLINAAGRV